MSKLKLYLIQSDLIWENPKSNLDFFADQIRKFTEKGLVVLPEMFTTGFSLNNTELAESMTGYSVNFLQELSKETGQAICGSIIIEENSKIFNRLLFITPEFTEFYDKRHLFSYSGEDKLFSKGSKKLIVEYEGWRICPLICYDLRFPVWSRNRNDYDLLIYVASWPETRRHVWDSLLKARAIENQALVVGVNRIGTDGEGLSYNGGSCIISEKGELIAQAQDNTFEIIEYTADLQNIKDFRSKFFAWKDADKFNIE